VIACSVLRPARLFENLVVKKFQLLSKGWCCVLHGKCIRRRAADAKPLRDSREKRENGRFCIRKKVMRDKEFAKSSRNSRVLVKNGRAKLPRLEGFLMH
jgi:hypothetical protein